MSKIVHLADCVQFTVFCMDVLNMFNKYTNAYDSKQTNGLVHNTKRCSTLFGHHKSTMHKIQKVIFSESYAELGFQHHSIYMHELSMSVYKTSRTEDSTFSIFIAIIKLLTQLAKIMENFTLNRMYCHVGSCFLNK